MQDASERPDLIIMDIMMPKVHGIDVLKAVVAESPVGVIMASAKSFKPDVDQAMTLGAFAFITKPFEEQDLVDAVGRFFAERSAAHARRRRPPTTPTPTPPRWTSRAATGNSGGRAGRSRSSGRSTPATAATRPAWRFPAAGKPFSSTPGPGFATPAWSWSRARRGTSGC